ncbi:MAG: TIGR02996 domain-containing protein [Planctomycetaceae bacterium]|nr:TIGR02996 domain-containing protein [Planctomycetaceae bacterium]
MSSDQSFLEVIRANPGEDTPKLIYADWLDEQSDPRGELIRLLVEVQTEREAHEHWSDFLYSVEDCFQTSDFAKLVQVLDETQQHLFACQCAESVLPFFETIFPRNRRPRKAIETTRAFLLGKATYKELQTTSRKLRNLDEKYLEKTPEKVIGAFQLAGSIVSFTRFLDIYAKPGYRDRPQYPEKAPAHRCAVVSAEAWGTEESAARIRQFLWLVERLLGFKTD